MLNSLRAKIFFLFIFGLALILALVMFYLSFELYNRFDKLYHQQAITAAQQLKLKTEKLFQLGLYPDELIGYEILCEEAVSINDGVAYAALANEQGKALFEAGINPNKIKKNTLPHLTLGQTHEYAVIQALEHPSGIETSIIISIDHNFINQQIRELIQKMLFYSFAVTLLGLGLVLLVLHYNLAVPIRQLVAHIQNVNINQLIPNNRVLFERKDEIGIVATTFNNLVTRLYTSQNALKNANSELMSLTNELEHRVQQRTIELSEANEKLDQLARTDSLTGLGNRHHFMETFQKQFKHAQRHRHNFAILMIDFDNFKNINDKFGHAAGDLVLKVIGNRLRNSLRDDDYSFRVGGDEFIILIEEYDTIEDLKNFIEKLQKRMSEPISYQSNPLSLGLSIGISCLEDYKDIEPHTLLSLADIAMYKAKSQGGGYFFSQPH